MSCYNTKALSDYLDKMDRDDIEDAYRNACEMQERLDKARSYYKDLYDMLYGKAPINTDDLDTLMQNLANAIDESDDLYQWAGLPTVQRFGQEPNYQAILFAKQNKCSEL